MAAPRLGCVEARGRSCSSLRLALERGGDVSASLPASLGQMGVLCKQPVFKAVITALLRLRLLCAAAQPTFHLPPPPRAVFLARNGSGGEAQQPEAAAFVEMRVLDQAAPWVSFGRVMVKPDVYTPTTRNWVRNQPRRRASKGPDARLRCIISCPVMCGCVQEEAQERGKGCCSSCRCCLHLEGCEFAFSWRTYIWRMRPPATHPLTSPCMPQGQDKFMPLDELRRTDRSYLLGDRLLMTVEIRIVAPGASSCN